jgi:hypothetical protein
MVLACVPAVPGILPSGLDRGDRGLQVRCPLDVADSGCPDGPAGAGHPGSWLRASIRTPASPPDGRADGRPGVTPALARRFFPRMAGQLPSESMGHPWGNFFKNFFIVPNSGMQPWYARRMYALRKETEPNLPKPLVAWVPRQRPRSTPLADGGLPRANRPGRGEAVRCHPWQRRPMPGMPGIRAPGRPGAEGKPAARASDGGDARPSRPTASMTTTGASPC